jgi:hypothetical protein
MDETLRLFPQGLMTACHVTYLANMLYYNVCGAFTGNAWLVVLRSTQSHDESCAMTLDIA